MSFILDALRKSETERQRQSGPGLADAPYRPPVRRRGIWLPLLVVVLLANLVLLSVVWLREPPAPAAPASEPVTPPPPAVAAAAQPPAETDYAAIADLPALEPPQGPPAPETAADGSAPSAQEPPASASATPGVVVDALPTAGQLMASGALPSRPMHLDIHVFSTTPAERFVFINMRKYTEGAQIAEGPQIEEITSEGVILSESGQRFLLTRD